MLFARFSQVRGVKVNSAKSLWAGWPTRRCATSVTVPCAIQSARISHWARSNRPAAFSHGDGGHGFVASATGTRVSAIVKTIATATLISTSTPDLLSVLRNHPTAPADFPGWCVRHDLQAMAAACSPCPACALPLRPASLPASPAPPAHARSRSRLSRRWRSRRTVPR